MSTQPNFIDPIPDTAHNKISAENSQEPYSRSQSKRSTSNTKTPIDDQAKDDRLFEFTSAKHTDHLKLVILPDGKKQVNQYIFLETLGKGSFGKVKLAYDVDIKTYYAIKIIDKALMKRKRVLGRNSVNDQLSNIRREIELLKIINHMNIVQMHEIIDDKNKDKLYIVLEHMPCGPVINLHDEDCSALPEEVCKFYLRDILSGLDYLHSLRIAHRDIKPDNLLLSQDGIVKISDFGTSMQFDDSNDFIRATAGSLAFMAPEMCLSEGAAYSAKKTDVWSAGITLYAMVFGKVPFTANTAAELYDKISQAKLECPQPISPALESLLRGMLEKDPWKRLCLNQLKEDPWLTDNGSQPFGAEIKWRLPGQNYGLHCTRHHQKWQQQQQQPSTSPVDNNIRTREPVNSTNYRSKAINNQTSGIQSVLRPFGRVCSCLKAVIRFFSNLRHRSAVQPSEQ